MSNVNNIKIKNSEAKACLKKYFPKDNYDNLLIALTNLCKRNNILKPIVIDAELGYDSLDIKISSEVMEFKNYIFSISSNDRSKLTVQRIGKNSYNVYKIYSCEDIALIKKIIFNDTKVIEKRYPESQREFYRYGYQGEFFDEYQYKYKEDDFSAKIIIVFPSNISFNEDFLIKTLLKNEKKISTIEELYTTISNILLGQERKISIVSLTNSDSLVVKNHELKEYHKMLKEDINDNEMIYYLNYQDGNVTITYQVQNPENNPVVRNVKKLIR